MTTPRETKLWQATKAHLGPFGSMVRIENKLETGVPDVNFALTHPPTGKTVSGWMELKRLDNWPVRGGMVNIPHLTLDQVKWAESWRGLSFMLLRVSQDYVVALPPLMRAIYGRSVTADDIRKRASVHSVGRFPTGDLLRWLVKVSTTI